MDIKIEFVSYDGKYPNFCDGKLVVKIDGKEISFGATKIFEKDKTPADYPRFWCSGGSIHFTRDYSDYNIEHGDWEMIGSEKDYPPEIWKILPDVLNVMNENVEGGCCGGCV
jgi:hypothetical protein